MSTDLLDEADGLVAHHPLTGAAQPARQGARRPASDDPFAAPSTPSPGQSRSPNNSQRPSPAHAGGAPPATRAAPSTAPGGGAPGAQPRWRLRFSTGVAQQGTGTLRQITYFPITVTPSAAPCESDVPLHWAPSPTLVYRRYSEMVLLRRYLILKYPGELMPALPAKTMSETFNTAMCVGTTLDAQGRMLAFFLDRLADKPTVYMHDAHVCDFLQLPRDSGDTPPNGQPETRQAGIKQYASFAATKTAIEQEIARLELELDKSDPAVFATSTSAVMGGLVRSTAKVLSSWWAGSGSTSPKAHQVTEDQVLEYVHSDTGYRMWMQLKLYFSQELTRIDAVYMEAVKVHTAAAEELAAERAVADAMGALVDAFADDADASLRNVAGGVSALCGPRAIAAKAMTSSSKHVATMLFNEALCVQGIIEAITMLMNRYRSHAFLRLNRVDPVPKQKIDQDYQRITRVAERLDRNVQSWKKGLHARLRDLGKLRSDRMAKALSDASTALLTSATYAFMSSPGYLEEVDIVPEGGLREHRGPAPPEASCS